MSNKNLQVVANAVIKGEQKDTGSLHLGGQLPTRFQKMGKPQEPLFIQLQGEDKPRQVTYIMGSQAKGWSVCCKGAGKFPTGADLSLEVDVLVEKSE